MKKFPVTHTHTFTAEQLSDLLCSAFEGGSNYWYYIEKSIVPSSWDFRSEPKGRTYWLQDYPLNPGGALLIRDLEDEERKLMLLDSQALARGLSILAEKYPEHLSDVLADNADATTGDVFLQCCLFGEVVFG